MVKKKDEQQDIEKDDVIETAQKRAEVEELQRELAEIKVEHEDIRTQLKRAIADYQNLEKRVKEGRSELSSWANSELIVKLLPVLDHLETALNGATETDKQSGWFKGVEMAVKYFKEVLRSEGLEEIVADGQFDPSLHEAVDTKDGENNKILAVARRGYRLQNRVVRPAQVIVGKEKN